MRDSGQTYNNNVDTLDHHVIAQTNAVKNNIRKALRTKYTIDEAVTIKHFGFIDQPPPAEVFNIIIQICAETTNTKDNSQFLIVG